MPLYRKPPKLIITRTLPKMPLVVPGVTTKEPDNKVEEPDNKLEEPDNKFEEPDNKLEEWSNKLVGKKITDDEASTSDEVVS